MLKLFLNYFQYTISFEVYDVYVWQNITLKSSKTVFTSVTIGLSTFVTQKLDDIESIITGVFKN